MKDFFFRKRISIAEYVLYCLLGGALLGIIQGLQDVGIL